MKIKKKQPNKRGGGGIKIKMDYHMYISIFSSFLNFISKAEQLPK